MTSSPVRVRFAPSPTGNVHIGNIRAAIFNWLYARHVHGKFILRVEDTDLERSTQEAINTLLEAMDWLGLTYDEEILYQTSQASKHIEATQQLIANGDAYLGTLSEGEAGAPTYFRIPWDVNRFPCVRKVGTVELELHPDVPVVLDPTGIAYAQMSRKGKPMEEKASLAGFHDLKLFDADGHECFDIESHWDALKAGESFTIEKVTKAVFTRHEVFYNDLVKGPLAKPLDTVRDFVIVRSNGSPVFHIANVVDDITQNITHIIRGDDHVENTYRHLFLFHVLGVNPPEYAHLPMIVNNENKPYSKRDGDAFVGDFRTKGFLPEALFNYLALLGWSAEDGRELMTRDELVSAFTLERCTSSPAKLDMMKLQSMNGHYLSQYSADNFENYLWPYAQTILGLNDLQRSLFHQLVPLMQGRIRFASQIADWAYFFSDEFKVDEKSLNKALALPNVKEAVAYFVANLPVEFSAQDIESLLRDAERVAGLDEGKLNQPMRLLVTGARGGAELDVTLSLIPRERILARIAKQI